MAGLFVRPHNTFGVSWIGVPGPIKSDANERSLFRRTLSVLGSSVQGDPWGACTVLTGAPFGSSTSLSSQYALKSFNLSSIWQQKQRLSKYQRIRRCKDPLTKLAQIIKIQFSHLFEANINGFLIQLRIYIVKLWTYAPQSNFLHVHVVSGKFSQIID